ncbi:MAG: MobF family relaxase, partial [Acidimicrobiales bacterium]
RGTADERVSLRTDGIAAAGFTHALSRARDPHLHTHLLVANLAHAQDGRWGAIDGRGLRAHARAAGAVYDAHLRMELSRRLSTSWSWRDKQGWELDGADPLLAAAFSGRAAEIRQGLGARGSTSARARHVAWASTREPKDLTGGRDAVVEDWSRRARIAPGWSLRQGGEGAPRHLDEYRFAAAVASAAPAGVCRRDVVAAWSEATGPGLDGARLEAAVDHWAPDSSVGVAEVHLGPAVCVPAAHLVRMLGPRPADPEGQPVWKGAAAVIDRYRERWGAGPSDLGSSGAPDWPARRLAEHLEVERSTREARAHLSWPTVAPRERDGLEVGR